jgi:hypothetical protein
MFDSTQNTFDADQYPLKKAEEQDGVLGRCHVRLEYHGLSTVC